MGFDPIRIYLLITFVPFAISMVSGRAGHVTWTDGLMFAFVLWMIVTLVFHHGAEKFPYSVVLAVEAFGGYMAGRLLVRSTADYRRFIRYYLITLLIASPLAVYELLYSRMLLSDWLGGMFSVTHKIAEERYGLSRVQVAFPHSILFGLFCSLAVASVYYLYRDSLFRLLPRLFLVMSMTLMSLSSAPMISMIIQLGIVFWGKLTGERWKLLATLIAIIYLVLELFSNRGAVVIFIETFTIRPMSGWWRVYIWRYGSASVMNHPFLGIGLNDWERPEWLASTVDNFWLLIAMRHGLPAFGFLALATGLHIFAIVRRHNLNPDAQLVRKGYMITLAGLIFTLSTVFIWEAMNVMVMFFIGAGAFLYTSRSNQPEATSGTPDQSLPQVRRGLPLSRYTPSHTTRTAFPRTVRAGDAPLSSPPEAAHK